jgi:cytochrome c oxidase assembly protein subunit 15
LRLPTVTPRGFVRLADAALVALFLIVLTGAAVRLTGSGLGCPDWPRCHGGVIPPLDTHAWIEYGNRMFSALVGIVAAAAGVMAWRRRPYRRDLALIGLALPLGVFAQAFVGKMAIDRHLAPEVIMVHYGLSMVLLAAAVALAWRARHEPGERPPRSDRKVVLGTRVLLGIGAVALLAGTVATAAGPHGGGTGTGDHIGRVQWRGIGTLDWAIHWHGRLANLLGLCTVALFFYARRRGVSPELRRAIFATGVLIAVQGAIGAAQYFLHLPAELVWLHVVLATATWVSLLYTVAVAGRPLDPAQDDQDLVPVGLDQLDAEREPMLAGERGQKSQQVL